MTTSGITALPVTRDELILAAMRKCGFAAEGETPSAQMMQNAADDLNRLIKGWQADGVKLWTYDELTLFLDKTSQSYVLGSGGANCTETDDIVSTTSTATAAIGATAITLASVSGISSEMFIGVLCDDGSLFWTTINGAPAGLVVTLTSGLLVAASSGAQVWAYTTKADRPLRIEQARIQTGATSEIEMTPLARADYFRIPNKSAQGTPIQFYYNPTLGTGTFYIWPIATSSALYINMTAYRSLDVFSVGTDTLDAPDETQQAVIWNLASEIYPEYGSDLNTAKMIETKAAQWLAKVEGFDEEESSLFIEPDFR